MKEPIQQEKRVHGARWDSVHEGYFSNPAIAAPLVRKIRQIARAAKPDMILDLGGGTGTLLAHLRAAGLNPGIALIALDDSLLQLKTAKAKGFSCVRGSVDSFMRRDIVPDTRRCLFIMRSVLHYFGKARLRPVLRHLRAQVRPGEFFVHQTASFLRWRDANCLNNLYRLMRTRKWYPTVAFLRRGLRAEGWKVLEVCPAPPLRLQTRDLMQRYQLTPGDLRRILDRMARQSRVPGDVFQKQKRGFAPCSPIGFTSAHRRHGSPATPMGSHWTRETQGRVGAEEIVAVLHHDPLKD